MMVFSHHPLSSQPDRSVASPRGIDQERSRLFDEHNDDGDDDVGYGNLGSTSGGLSVILTKPDRSPIEQPASGRSCCGQTKPTTTIGAASDEDSNASLHGLPPPVLVGGLERKGLRSMRYSPHKFEESLHKELAREAASPVSGDEQERDRGKKNIGTEVSIRR